MSVTVSVNGSNYTIPQTNETGWGDAVTSWIQAVSSSTLQKNGGTFALTAEVDFGASFSIKGIYFKSRSSNIASTGIVRLARTDAVSWRNNANSDNLPLTVDTSDRLTFDGVPISSPVALVASKAVVTDANADLSSSSTTAAQILLLSGMTAPAAASLAVVTQSGDGLATSVTTADQIALLSGLSSPAVGTTQTQTLTNKTLSTATNSFPLLNEWSNQTNVGIVCSVGSSALTVALKGADGNDPSSSNPVSIGFRSSTATSGAYNVRTVTAATSVVVSSGSTLGMGNNDPAYLYVYALDNAGTVELAISYSYLIQTLYTAPQQRVGQGPRIVTECCTQPQRGQMFLSGC